MICKNVHCGKEIPEGMTICPSCGASVSPIQDADGPTLYGLQSEIVLAGKFRLVHRLGSGGMGDVWLAQDTHLDEPVAVKVLKTELAGDKFAVGDMKKEVKITRSLRHPHIVAVHEYYESKGVNFITMEYVPGDSLAHVLQERGTPFTLQEIGSWLEQLTSALDYAHDQGVLHRDIKPANILLDRKGKVKLADFGIARLAKDSHTRLTGQMTSGTLLYMSPEQLMGEELDIRSDIYSLAASVYELLCGHPPFYTGSIPTQIQFKPTPPIPGLDESVNKALQSGLAKEKEDRPASARIFSDELCGRYVQAERIQVISTPQVRIPQTISIPPDTSTLTAGTVQTFNGFKMVWCPPGTFTMGSNKYDSEKPPHEVTLTKGFWMGKYEVTQEQWERVMGSNPSNFKGSKRPVEMVSWEDIQTFLQKLNAKGAGNFRLPTEAEWEYACRAGSTTEYCFGNDPLVLGSYAWYAKNSGNQTHEVGTKQANAWNLHDMHGNVFEWCQDLYGDYPSGSVTDPKGPSFGTGPVLRGGSWYYDDHRCRSADRTYGTPDGRYNGLGFRVARTP